MNYFLISRTLGMLLAVFSLTMLFMVPFALWFAEFEQLFQIVESTVLCAGLGGLLYFIGKKAKGDLYRREALAIVGLGWLSIAGFGAIPFLLGGMVDTFTDAYFESMSGLTTTGASILTDIESQSRSLLFWRSFLHFVGGLGIIVFFVAILPILGVGGKALFKQEVPGPVPEGLTPRIKDTAISLCKIYISLNIIEFIILMLCGMSFYDALNHAMATMATGGFSTKNASVGHYLKHTELIEWTIILFMFLAGTNFSLHLRLTKGDWLCYFRDTEFRVYLGIIVCGTAFFTLVLYMTGASAVSEPGGISIRDSLFTTVAILTTTGFGTVNFDQWPEVCRLLLLLFMFIGGMAGSTAGGIKIIRSVILLKSATHQISTQATPRVVRALKIDGRVLDRTTQSQVLAFFFLYTAIYVLMSVIVTLANPDNSLLTSVSAVIASLNNIGPGLDAVGPHMNYASQTAAAKWVLSLCMVLGRIELYAILILFTPNFWIGR